MRVGPEITATDIFMRNHAHPDTVRLHMDRHYLAAKRCGLSGVLHAWAARGGVSPLVSIGGNIEAISDLITDWAKTCNGPFGRLLGGDVCLDNEVPDGYVLMTFEDTNQNLVRVDGMKFQLRPEQ